ncbi:relaxase/mobilization nuclease domain-containing protein [Levilactobacillus brevis]
MGKKANDLGCALAEKLYPAYQSAVYTHIDGEHHILHNHIIVSKVNLETGKKMQDTQEQMEAAEEVVAKWDFKKQNYFIW